MPKFQSNQILPFSTAQLFDLVLDIKSYPEFLPWCSAARITKREESIIIADLVIKFKSFREQYSSKVTFQTNQLIEAEAISGPFKYLYNKWVFAEISPNSTEIDFFIDFEFNVSLLSMITNLIFQESASKMLSAFEDRARLVYSL